MNTITLSDAQPGKRYCIMEIKEENRLVNRLSSMGLLCGSTVEICQNYKKQPVLLFARDTLVAIGREESKKIMIKTRDLFAPALNGQLFSINEYHFMIRGVENIKLNTEHIAWNIKLTVFTSC